MELNQENFDKLVRAVKKLQEANKVSSAPSTRKQWTKEEVAYLKNVYRTNSYEDISADWSKNFGYTRTIDSIRRKIQRTFKQ